MRTFNDFASLRAANMGSCRTANHWGKRELRHASDRLGEMLVAFDDIDDVFVDMNAQNSPEKKALYDATNRLLDGLNGVRKAYGSYLQSVHNDYYGTANKTFQEAKADGDFKGHDAHGSIDKIAMADALMTIAAHAENLGYGAIEQKCLSLMRQLAGDAYDELSGQGAVTPDSQKANDTLMDYAAEMKG